MFLLLGSWRSRWLVSTRSWPLIRCSVRQLVCSDLFSVVLRRFVVIVVLSVVRSDGACRVGLCLLCASRVNRMTNLILWTLFGFSPMLLLSLCCVILVLTTVPTACSLLTVPKLRQWWQMKGCSDLSRCLLVVWLFVIGCVPTYVQCL